MTAWRQPAVVGGLPVRPGIWWWPTPTARSSSPPGSPAETVGRALDKVSKENRVRDALAAGSTLRSAYDRFGVL